MRKQLPPFTPMYVETIDSPAWRTLPHGARSLYVYMKRHYNRKQQKAVYLSIRVAAKELGASRNTIAGWLHALSIGGFIALIHGGFLGADGYGKAALYRLTDEPFQGEAPTRDFLRNGTPEKIKSRLKNRATLLQNRATNGSKTEPPKAENPAKRGGSKIATHLEEASSHIGAEGRGVRD